jgi:tetratricopeptide (TPR) repeat protein
LAGAILARALWLQGHPDQAIERALLTIEDAEGLDHPLTLSITLVWAVSVFLWVGDLARADQHIERLFARAEPHSLGPYLAVGRGFQGELAIRRGDADGGIRSLRHSLTELHSAPYELLTTPLNIALVQGLAATRRFDEALALIDETLQSAETNGDLCYTPELLRVKGSLVLAAPRSDADQAEICFTRSLELSRRQGALAWELRTAIDLAALLAARGERDHGQGILTPVFERFAERLNTADLDAAARLLSTLG